jgi:diguanylate cyclase (GGDEF)-like protein/PAS domain S-box-containing protein
MAASVLQQHAPAVARPSFASPRSWHPFSNLHIGLRLWVLGGSALVVIGLSFAVSTAASGQLRAAASEAAVENAQAIVRGYVDTILTEDDLDIDAAEDPAVAEQLRRLVISGDMRRINIWSRDGRVMYSTDESLRGARLGIDHELAEALAGDTHAEFGSPSGAGPHTGLPERYLEIYAPIRGDSDGNPIGVFEVYVDAAPIESRVADTRIAVLLISLAAGAILLTALWLAFAGTSRRLASQNLSLSQLNEQLGGMADDLRHREARFRSLVENSSDVVTLLDADGVVTYVSDAVRGVLGRDPGDVAGRPFVTEVHPADTQLASSMLAGLTSTPGGHQSIEMRLRHADGAWRWVEVVGQSRLDEAAVGALVLNYRDVTQRKGLEAQLQHEAFHDPLTSLANRALFGDRVTHALARRGGPDERAAVLFVDLDDFKLVNDSLGHAAGDQLLTAVAERIRACLRRGDTAARLGGDEFAILLEETDEDGAAEIAERIQEALRQPFSIGDRQLFTQASIGIAVSSHGLRPMEGETADELLRNADAAMYTAKARGKARHQLYQPTMHASAMRRLELRGRLEAALAAGEFEVHYQPIVELGGLGIVGAEALLRWPTHDVKHVPTAEFVSVAEESGLIVPMGRWVLEQACREASGWNVSGPRGPLSVAVNVASRQFQDPAFAGDVADALEATSLPPARLVLELTESTLLDEGPVMSSAIAELKRLGVRIALDDFGTGYSSLSHLRRFPIDILKIDQSFVAGIDGDSRDERALVRSIVRLALSLRLDTVAEGVERSEQLNILRTFGARLGQGFLFARPMDAAAFRRHISGAGSIAS